jgi:hypothetical protein
MQLATYAFFLDLRKAYDTVWRDGLMYKLWQAGVRGRLWHYISRLPVLSRKAVRVGGHISEVIEIDLGVAQGDTLSCILKGIQETFSISLPMISLISLKKNPLPPDKCTGGGLRKGGYVQPDHGSGPPLPTH